VGASRSRCVLVRPDGEVVAHATGPGAAFQPARARQATEALAETVAAAAREAGCSLPLAGLGAGVAGVGHQEHRRQLLALLEQKGLTERIALTHDAEIALWGAFGRGAGIVVIAGTGSIAYGRSAEGREVRVGGWGREIDDAGGGWWLGREVLRLVLRAYDGRGPSTAMMPRLVAATGVRQLPDLVAWVRRETRTPRDIAELSQVAEEAAASGDPVARELLARAGQELAELLAAADRALGLKNEHRRAALVGGLAQRAQGVRKAFEEVVERLAPGVKLQKPWLPAVAGAVLKIADELGLAEQEKLAERLAAQTTTLPKEWGYER